MSKKRERVGVCLLLCHGLSLSLSLSLSQTCRHQPVCVMALPPIHAAALSPPPLHLLPPACPPPTCSSTFVLPPSLPLTQSLLIEFSCLETRCQAEAAAGRRRRRHRHRHRLASAPPLPRPPFLAPLHACSGSSTPASWLLVPENSCPGGAAALPPLCEVAASHRVAVRDDPAAAPHPAEVGEPPRPHHIRRGVAQRGQQLLARVESHQLDRGRRPRSDRLRRGDRWRAPCHPYTRKARRTVHSARQRASHAG